MPRHIRKGDQVIINTGEFRGQTGTIIRVLTKEDRVVVKGTGIRGIVRTLKPTRTNPQGGQIEADRSFHMSNVNPVIDGKASRVRFPMKKDGSKVRVAARGGSELGKVHAARKSKSKA